MHTPTRKTYQGTHLEVNSKDINLSRMARTRQTDKTADILHKLANGELTFEEVDNKVEFVYDGMFVSFELEKKLGILRMVNIFVSTEEEIAPRVSKLRSA
jgi:hypothetical protein